MKRNKSCVVFTGGGSGGHVFPGIAVLEKLKESIEQNNDTVDVLWIGSKYGIERSICRDYGITYEAIQTGKLRRYVSFKNFIDVFRVVLGIIKSIFLLIRLKPSLVFSKGGFVSVPVVLAAAFLRIPIIIHESDYDPGLATKIASRFASIICLPTEESRKFFVQRTGQKIVTSGNPIRGDIFTGQSERAKAFLSYSGKKPLVFFIGGSLGATQINTLLEPVLGRILEKAFVVHQRGKHPKIEIQGKSDGYRSSEFYRKEYSDILHASDIVVSRAGAGSLWELACTGKASILIPLKSGSRGDQLRNADFFAEKGAAINLGPNPGSKNLEESILQLLEDRDRRETISSKITGIVKVDAAKTISDLILSKLQAETKR